MGDDMFVSFQEELDHYIQSTDHILSLLRDEEYWSVDGIESADSRPSASSDDAHGLRRDLLDELYRLYKSKPGAFLVAHADRDDPKRMAMKREADYLKEKGLLSGSVGPDGGLQIKLTAAGRDHVEETMTLSSKVTVAYVEPLRRDYQEVIQRAGDEARTDGARSTDGQRRDGSHRVGPRRGHGSVQSQRHHVCDRAGNGVVQGGAQARAGFSHVGHYPRLQYRKPDPSR